MTGDALGRPNQKPVGDGVGAANIRPLLNEKG